MKKFIAILIVLLGAGTLLQAQTSGAVVTTVPSSFTAEDQVKIIIDVSAVPNLAGKEPLYIWTWEPGDPSPGNGNWDNSNEGRRLVKESANVWSWTMTPTQYYGKSPAEITQISFLVKAKDGSGDAKSDDIKLAVAPLIFVPTVFRTFPKVVGQNEVVTFYLDQSLATDLTTQRMTPVTATVSLWSGATQVGTDKTVTLKKQADKLYSYTFLPKILFTIPAGVTVTKMQVVFKGKGKDTGGQEIDVESPPFEYGFDELK